MRKIITRSNYAYFIAHCTSLFFNTHPFKWDMREADRLLSVKESVSDGDLMPSSSSPSPSGSFRPVISANSSSSLHCKFGIRCRSMYVRAPVQSSSRPASVRPQRPSVRCSFVRATLTAPATRSSALRLDLQHSTRWRTRNIFNDL